MAGDGDELPREGEFLRGAPGIGLRMKPCSPIARHKCIQGTNGW